MKVVYEDWNYYMEITSTYININKRRSVDWHRVTTLQHPLLVRLPYLTFTLH